MNRRPKLLKCAAVAIAITCCGVAFAADQEKDASDKGKKSTLSGSSAAPGADAGRSNTAEPGALKDVPKKDRKIVAPDNFGSKDRKIIAQDKKGSLIVPGENEKKPVLAAPEAAPSTSGTTTASK